MAPRSLQRAVLIIFMLRTQASPSQHQGPRRNSHQTGSFASVSNHKHPAWPSEHHSGKPLIFPFNHTYSQSSSLRTRSVDPPEPDSGLFKVDVEGDVIFGGLFPMHEQGQQGKNCGNIKTEKGIQRLEAMLFAVDLINRDPHLLPGLKVGMRILDTCSYDTFALEQCMDFIKAHLSTIDLKDYRCNDNQIPAYNRHKPVAGVIGAASSTVSIMVANILRLFKVSVSINLHG